MSNTKNTGLVALGVVVIGRNEGERLARCLASIADRGAVVVYVDSGSTDGSVALARSRGLEVVELDRSAPFSAARARNAGFARLRQVDPDLSFVQFVDGDCEVVDGWLEQGLSELTANPSTAIVCGRRRERRPGASLYNRVADLEWDTPIGLAESCGGDAMMRVSAFEAVGGFDPTVTAGEEPELCARLRRAGWAIVRVDGEMTLHDLNVTSFGPWWRRQVRGGYGGLDVTRRMAGAGPFARQVRSARIWTVGWLLLVVAAGTSAFLLGGRSAAGWAVGIGSALPVLQMLRLAIKVRTSTGDVATAFGYGALTVIGKWGELLGQARFLRDRAARRRVRLIEYKESAVTPMGASS